MRAREWGLAGLALTALGVFLPVYKVILFGDVSLFDLYRLSAIGLSGRVHEAMIVLVKGKSQEGLTCKVGIYGL